ncbi:MAG: hypothetical protein K6F63_09935 [Lachnospiraceae bacterium]|nr:hypothetical protein [Lachnospiraceae bacterium]
MLLQPAEGEKDHTVSVWYVEVMEKYDKDSDGVAVYWDKYIDVIATPQGDIRVDDRDEPDEAALFGTLPEVQKVPMDKQNKR